MPFASFLFLAFLILLPGAALGKTALVEGNVDYDEDGRVGPAEDLDGDLVFSEIQTALGGSGIEFNGNVLIVSSGLYFGFNLPGLPDGSNVTIAAVEGVSAIIDPVRGDTSDATRQARAGIQVTPRASGTIVLRNLTVRNFWTGLIVHGNGRTIIDRCRFENNITRGILVRQEACAVITDSQILNTGFQVGPIGNYPNIDAPNPGNGIDFESNARGAIVRTSIVGSSGRGVLSRSSQQVYLKEATIFDNNGDRGGRLRSLLNFF